MMKGCALSLKGTRYDRYNQKQVLINMRQEKEGIGIIKYKCQLEKPHALSGRKYDWHYQSQHQSKERQKGYVLSSKGKGDIIGGIKRVPIKKGNDERLCLILKRQERSVLG